MAENGINLIRFYKASANVARGFLFSTLLTTIVLFSFSLSANPGSGSSNLSSKGDIVWETSILKAMERAKKENKPIIVELYADWCTTCKTLESKILPDRDVQKSIQPYVAVRLNGEEYPNLMERYEARGFPTILFLDKYTNYISKIQGLPDKAMLIREARIALSNSDTEKKLIANQKDSPNSIRALFELGIYYYQAEDYPKSGSYFARIIKMQSSSEPDKDLIRQSLYNLALIRMNQNNYTMAISHWNEYINRYNDSSLSGAYLHRGIAWRERKDRDKAIADLKKAKSLSKEQEELEIIEEEIQSIIASKN